MPARDSALLDAVEALPHGPRDIQVWRAVRDGRDPLQCSAAGGRWDDGTFEVLYTATHPAGAAAEILFHLRRGQPVSPSRVRYRLYRLRAQLADCITLPDLAALSRLGLNTAQFGQLAYAERAAEYPRTQDIAETARFLGRDSLDVPSARSEHPNLIVFCGTTAIVKVDGDEGVI